MQVLLDFIRQINDDDGSVLRIAFFFPLLCHFLVSYYLKPYMNMKIVCLCLIWLIWKNLILTVQWKSKDTVMDHLYINLQQWCFLFDSFFCWPGDGLGLESCKIYLNYYLSLSRLKVKVAFSLLTEFCGTLILFVCVIVFVSVYIYIYIF